LKNNSYYFENSLLKEISETLRCFVTLLGSDQVSNCWVLGYRIMNQGAVIWIDGRYETLRN